MTQDPRDLHPLDALLLDCLHRDPSRLDRAALTNLSPAEWEDLSARARRQRIRPMLHQRLLALGGPAIVPPGTWTDLTATCTSIALRNLYLHAELAVLVRSFDAEGIPVIALKGIHVATAVYGGVGRREMSDVDVLVPRACLERAGALALAHGYTATQPYSVDTDVAVSHHLGTFAKGRARLEIHWNIVEPRRSYSIDPAPLVERSVAFAMPGASLRALAFEDLVLHLCAHTAYQHRFEFGMRSLCDLTMLVERCGETLDWAAVVSRANAWGWSRGVHLTLALAGDLLGARVPAEVLQGFGVVLDDRVRAAARTAVLVGFEGGEPMLALGVSSLATARSVPEAARHLFARVFVQPEELSRRLGVPPVSRGWNVRLYARRVIGLVRRDTVSLLRLVFRRDPRLTDQSDRRARLISWLGLGTY